MALVDVQIIVENNYTEDLIVESQEPEQGNVTQSFPDTIFPGGTTDQFMVYCYINTYRNATYLCTRSYHFHLVYRLMQLQRTVELKAR